jgi:hypothetical protein
MPKTDSLLPYELTLTLGHGDDTETYILKPTLEVIRRLDRQFGGMTALFETCRQLSFASAVKVIAIGADVKGEKALRRLEQRVFSRGLTRVSPKVVEFVGVIGNGGRPLDYEEDDDALDDDDGEDGEGNA